MKKFILSLGLIAMAFNLTNCAQYEEATPSVETKGDFALYASVSRTANDGLNTVWSTGDDLGVFHAVTDGTTYTKDGQFKLEDATTGCFLGNVNGTLDSQEEYDWYAMYPYSSYVPGPKNTGSGYMTIGCAASGTQTQTGNNSLAHVAGKNFPLVGKAYAVPAGSAPALAMTHVATLLEFEVTNSLDEAITVSNIKFTAPAALVGTFYIDFTDIANITATSSGSSYTSKSATLIVKNGEAIAAGASAKFYLPVAPFTAAANAKLALEVNVTAGEKVGLLSKEITLATETSFKAGKIKNVKVNYDAEFVEEGIALPFEDNFAWATGEAELSASSLNKNYSTSTKVYANNGDLKFGTSSALGSISTAPLNLSQPFTVAVDAKCWSGDTSVLKITVNGVTQKTATLPEAFESYLFRFDAATSASVIKFEITGTGTDASKHRGHIDNLKVIAGHDYVLPPVLKLDSNLLNVQAEANTNTVGYTVKNPVDGISVTAVSNNDWITVTPATNSLTIAVAENTGDERTGTVTVSYEGVANQTITVTQAAPKSDDVVVTEKSVTHNFVNNATFKTWDSSYKARTIEFTEATVKFKSANKQSSTITDMPVTKGNDVELIAKNGATMKSVKFTCKKWSSKAQTITFHYSTNGGSSYTKTTKTSTNFVIEYNDLPAGTNAVKITFSSTSNQVGIQQADVTYLIEE